jgi:hypothetical protein
VSVHLALVPSDEPARVGRDRLEVLSALMHASGFDPLYRADVIVFPADHPAYGWECGVPQCERPRTWIAGAGLCQVHYQAWLTARRSGMTKAAFLRGATPLQGNRGFLTACRICPGRPTATRVSDLCRRHYDGWLRHRATRDFDDWLAEQVAYDGYGTCQVVVCAGLADGPLGLCTGHRERYRDDGRPGGACLPANWLHRLESRGLPVPVDYADETAFRPGAPPRGRSGTWARSACSGCSR